MSYELDLTHQDVAEQAGTSHSFISKLETGDHTLTIPVLKGIFAVLDEELLIGIERRSPTESRNERSRRCPSQPPAERGALAA